MREKIIIFILIPFRGPLALGVFMRAGRLAAMGRLGSFCCARQHVGADISLFLQKFSKVRLFFPISTSLLKGVVPMRY